MSFVNLFNPRMGRIYWEQFSEIILHHTLGIRHLLCVLKSRVLILFVFVYSLYAYGCGWNCLPILFAWQHIEEKKEKKTIRNYKESNSRTYHIESSSKDIGGSLIDWILVYHTTVYKQTKYWKVNKFVDVCCVIALKR